MADPTQLADIFDVQVNFVPAVASGRFGFTIPTVVSEFAANPSFPDRIKSYTGTVTQKLALVLADGFTEDSPVYRQVQIAGIQDGPSRTIYVGRKDAADADWGTAMAAVKSDADLKGLNFYAFSVEARLAADIESIADYLEGDPDAPVFALYIAQTQDLNVLNNNPGNVALNILAKNYQRTALLWHDPATSSGFGPAILQSIIQPYNIPNASTIELRIDGGATQIFTFDSIAAELLGSNTETFAVLNGEQLIVALNNTSTQTITCEALAAFINSNNPQNYPFVDGMTLTVRVDGGTAETAIFNGTAPAITTATEPYAFAADSVTFSVNGAPNQTINLGASEVDAATLTTAFAGVVGVTVSNNGTDVTLTNNRIGSSADIEIVAITANALTELGPAFAVGNNFGTGFAEFLDQATAAEVATEISTDITGATGSAPGPFVRIDSDLIGTGSRIQVTGGTANDILKFDSNEVKGSGDFINAAVATAAEVVTKINLNLAGGFAEVDTGAVKITSTVFGTLSQIDVSASTLATTLGFSTTAVDGTGDFSNAAKATAGEVAVKIADTLVDGVASSAQSKVLITSNTDGTDSTVDAVGGTLLDILRFADINTSVANSAVGTGVQEDFADAAWLGRCVTFDLDAPRQDESVPSWDNQPLKGPSTTGAGAVSLPGDRNLASFRSTLHTTLRVNTYELRSGRNETHFGTLLNDQLGAGDYIDVRTTADWFAARILEKFKGISDDASQQKQGIPYQPSGIDKFDNGYREVLRRGETNGHTIYDDSVLDIDNPTDTGIITPTNRGQTQQDINDRLIDGFTARQLIQGNIQRGRVVLNLIGPTSTL